MKVALKLVLMVFCLSVFTQCSNPEPSLLDNQNNGELPEEDEEEEEVVKDWRALANERIDLYRKSDLSLTVKNSAGNPVNAATVFVKLKRHKFNFGAVIRSLDFESSPYSAVYKQTFLKYFNAAGFANGLKPRQRGQVLEQRATEIMPWLIANAINVRGHALQWEGYKNQRNEIRAVYDDPNLSNLEKGLKMIELSEVHFNHTIPKWDVSAWDVCNEMINNSIINDLVSTNTFTYWFKLADELRVKYNRPDVKLYMNDYQVITAFYGYAQSRPDDYKAIMDQMILEGAPIEGIGFQSRFKGGYITPELMYERLQGFDRYNLPLQATEFEIRDGDDYTYPDAQKRQIVNEFLTIYFSHPNMDGIWHWTYLDDSKGEQPWALFKYDGTPYPCGEEWMRTMDEDFNTDVELTTDASGVASVRGFKGEYEITVTINGNKTTQTIVLDENGTFDIQI